MPPPRFKFRLYLPGNGPNSTQAMTSLRALCQAHLSERHEIEVIDVVSEPQRALTDGVVLTPMLVKVSPSPVRRIVRNLSNQRPPSQRCAYQIDL
jgi:circadian clock protein KaiB